MNTINRLIPSAIAVAAIFVCRLSIAAPLSNGGFETGTFSPWTTGGIATVAGTTSGVAPVEGNFQAIINTPASGTVSQGNLETFLGLAGLTLAQYNGGSNSNGGGSAFKQTFDITAGQAISFRWNFLPNGNVSSGSQNDTAFFTIHLASDTSSSAVFTLSSTSLSGGVATGYQTFTTPILAAGTYLLGFAENDQKQIAGSQNSQRPTLFIDNVAAVPEPTTISLLGMGLAAGGAYFLKRRRG